MLHRTVAANAMGMTTLARFVVVSAVLLGLLSAGGSADAATPEPARHCLGSESAVNDNLPLGTSSDSTEITEIRGILAGTPRRVVGWLYTTRSGRQFVQSQSPAEVAHLLVRAGAGRLAERVKSSPAAAYFAVSATTAASLRGLASRGVRFVACLGTGRNA